LFTNFLAAPPRNEVLEAMGRLVDWAGLRAQMASAYSVGVGCVGYDPVMLFKLLVLERLYDLSDGEAVHMASDSLSFRAFLGLLASDRVPDDTTLVKFRKRLREAGQFDALFGVIMAQMEARGLGVRQGSIKIVDATLVPAAVRGPRKPRDGGAEPAPLDPDAEVSSKNGEAHYGYKLRHATDRETGLVTAHVLTGGATHDSQVFEELLDGSESEVLADKGYDSRRLREHLRRNKTRALIMRRARRGRPLSRWQKTRNRTISRRFASSLREPTPRSSAGASAGAPFTAGLSAIGCSVPWGCWRTM